VTTPAEPPGAPTAGAQAEALWAIAAAIERLADVIAAAGHPARYPKHTRTGPNERS
jgi:hypothetical protein